MSAGILGCRMIGERKGYDGRGPLLRRFLIITE